MRKALVVGINDYPTAPLTACINDAAAVGALLRSNSDGSPNFDVMAQYDVKDKTELFEMIERLFEGDSDIALFYFSGHGYLDPLGGYLVTPDARKYDYGISMDELLKIANKSKAKNRILILDCCHSGALGSPNNGSGSVSAQINEGVTILTASRDSEVSIEDRIMGHGIFTSLLINALNGGAADLRGNVTPGSIYSYIDQALGSWDQRPVFKTNVTRFLSLRNVTPRVPLSTLRRITELFESPEDVFALDPSFEDTNDPTIIHDTVEPFANPENTEKFKILQKLQSVGLVIPVDEDHMYFAAMRGTGCRLTALGYHYWKLVRDRRI